MMFYRERIQKKKTKVKVVKPHHQDKRWKFPICCGDMTKEGSGFKSWKRRYFILTALGKLWYFKNSSSMDPLKEPVVVKGALYSYARDKKKRNCIKIVSPKRPKPFFFFADSQASYDRWMNKLFEAGAINQYNFFGSNLKRISDYNFPYCLVELMDVIRDKINKSALKYVFQKTGSKNNIEDIKRSMIEAEGDKEYFKEQDIYDLCDCLKTFSHAVPEAFLSHFYEELMDAVKKKNEEKRKALIIELMEENMKEEYPLVFGFCREFLSLLHEAGVKLAKKTKQSPKKLAPIFAAMFLRPEGDDEVPLHQMDKVNKLVTEFIKNYEDYFGECYRSSKKKNEDEFDEESGDDSGPSSDEEESSEEEEKVKPPKKVVKKVVVKKRVVAQKSKKKKKETSSEEESSSGESSSGETDSEEESSEEEVKKKVVKKVIKKVVPKKVVAKKPPPEKVAKKKKKETSSEEESSSSEEDDSGESSDESSSEEEKKKKKQKKVVKQKQKAKPKKKKKSSSSSDNDDVPPPPAEDAPDVEEEDSDSDSDDEGGPPPPPPGADDLQMKKVAPSGGGDRGALFAAINAGGFQLKKTSTKKPLSPKSMAKEKEKKPMGGGGMGGMGGMMAMIQARARARNRGGLNGARSGGNFGNRDGNRGGNRGGGNKVDLRGGPSRPSGPSRPTKRRSQPKPKEPEPEPEPEPEKESKDSDSSEGSDSDSDSSDDEGPAPPPPPGDDDLKMKKVAPSGGGDRGALFAAINAGGFQLKKTKTKKPLSPKSMAKAKEKKPSGGMGGAGGGMMAAIQAAARRRQQNRN